MGANCCVAAKQKSLQHRTGIEVSTHRNIRYSPSWSFRWDNRTHIEDIVDNPVRFSRGVSRNVGSEIKSSVDTETEGLSDGGSPLDYFETSTWRKSPIDGRIAGNSNGSEADLSVGSNSSSEEKDPMKLSANESMSRSKASIPISTPASFASKAEPSSSRSQSLPSDPTSSRRARHSPGYQLSRQISDSRIPTLKSLNENNSDEGRQSFVLSVCSNDLSTGGSHGGSSDGWSMRTFSELVASSQRERWSFDSENMSCGHGKITRSNSQPFVSPPADMQTCGVCSKLLKERSSWSSHKIISNNELSVVAILVCGHVYHAECLENVTSETERFDPSCPVCTIGEKSASKILGKAELKARNKISRIAVADVDHDGFSIMERRKSAEREGKGPKMGASSSLKVSFGRPFLRRHFSLGSKPSRSASDNESTKKKSFWTKYRKE